MKTFRKLFILFAVVGLTVMSITIATIAMSIDPTTITETTLLVVTPIQVFGLSTGAMLAAFGLVLYVPFLVKDITSDIETDVQRSHELLRNLSQR